MSSMHWSPSMEETLIECVREHEIIYDNKCQHYKNASLKQEVWEHIGTELNVSASDCKTKWNKLRNAFVHALLRRKAGQGVKNFKKWKYEEEMSYLLPYIGQRNTTYIIRNTSSNIDDTEDSQDSVTITIDEDSENENVSQRKRKVENIKSDPVKFYQKQILNDPLHIAMDQKTEKDEIDLLFESMAKTVKKFPRLEQIKLKRGLMNMVNEVELRCLESGELV